jgi:transposase
MRPFGAQIAATRMPNGDLSEAERIYILAQWEGGCSARETSDALGCAQRTVQRVIQRFEADNTHEKRTRMGRPAKLTSRDHRRLLREVKKSPKIEYHQLAQAAGLIDPTTMRATLSNRTIQRALAAEGYYKFRAARRSKFDNLVAQLRLNFAQQWRNLGWLNTTFRFSDECSVARGSGHNTTWVWRLPHQKWEREMIEPVSTGRQPAIMVWGSIWVTPNGGVGRSPLVIMQRDETAARNGYSAWSYIQALQEGLLPNYMPGEWFMQDNARIYTA